jgi:hypothetical protein
MLERQPLLSSPLAFIILAAIPLISHLYYFTLDFHFSSTQSGFSFLLWLQFILFRNFALREKKSISNQNSEASISTTKRKSDAGYENLIFLLHLTSFKGIFAFDFLIGTPR